MLCVHSAARRRFFCAAIVSTSVAIGFWSQAKAEGYSYWTESDPSIYRSIYRPEPRLIPPRRAKVPRPHQAVGTIEQQAAKPQGPLIIAVSINKQHVKVYDSNGLFAEAPVSTGMKGHSTPTGVFSVIQKQKYHRSNIYSGAPMPFMQRITWSGIALHAGVLPGYPASHGCIRMPPSFAVKMYGWTRMGARVLVTPGEVEPTGFTHPLLVALKAPQPSASAQPDLPAAPKADKRAALPPSAPPKDQLDLRTSIGPGMETKSADAALVLRSQTHTADAGNASLPATLIDAPPAGVAAGPDGTRSPAEILNRDATAAGYLTSQPGHSAPAEIGTADKPEDVTGTSAASSSSAPADRKQSDTKAAETPAASAGKDQTRLSEAEQPLPLKPELKHNSPLAIFISRKDGKLYVRQNLAAVFKTEVTIAPGDRPLGTHVFTATADKTEAAVLRWSVVSLPMSMHSSARSEDGERTARRAKQPNDMPAESKPTPDSPAEALDRVTIPADVMAWLGEALSSGSSVIVSDQGINQGETGEGTEFILSLR